MKLTNQKGSLLIEVMVSAALLVSFSAGIGGLMAMNNRLMSTSRHTTQATALAKEAMERAYAIKQANWSDLSNLAEGKYQIQQAGNVFSFIPNEAGEQIDDTFIRTVGVYRAYRDNSGNLALSGTEDANARRLETVVTWQEHGLDHRVQLTSYITNWKGI
jgi:hypothetical protein